MISRQRLTPLTLAALAAILAGYCLALPSPTARAWSKETASDEADADEALFPADKKAAEKQESPAVKAAATDRPDDAADPASSDTAASDKASSETQSSEASPSNNAPVGKSAVDSGKDAFGRVGDFNWYDKTQDAARRLTVYPAPAPSTQSTSTTSSTSSSSSSSNFNMSFSWGSVFGWIGISVLLGIIAWLLIRVFLMRERRLAQHSHTDLVTTGTDADRVENLPIPVRRPAGDLLSEARMHYENGNYRDAIIYLYSHQLVSLDKHQMIRLVRGKTNRQYLRDLVSRQPLRGLLEQTMLTFEDVFFGDLAITRERFETCWKRLPDFDALVQGARA